MACGDISWWRSPDLVGLLERHGQAEHLVVQIDFLIQPQRLGRAEFSIPGASKKGDGSTGYADVVSTVSSEIWEIKPEHLETAAAKEAGWYVQNAAKSCGPNWRAGTSYTASNRYGVPGLVYRIDGGGNKAELYAKQGQAGAILYYWEINGKREPSLEKKWSWALRQAIVSDYFSVGPPLQPLPGSKAPDNLPPGKFKPPVLTPGSCIPEFGKIIDPLLKSIQTTCAPVIFENGAVAILVHETMYNAIVGPRIVAQQKQMMKVQTGDPSVALYRETLAILTAASLTHAAVATALAVGALIIIAIVLKPELVGGGIAVVVEAEAATAAPALATGGVLGTFSAGLAANAPTAVAAGAGLVVFAIPRASQADPETPVGVDISLPKFVVLTPAQATKVQLGRTFVIDGANWYVAGLATTGPG